MSSPIDDHSNGLSFNVFQNNSDATIKLEEVKQQPKIQLEEVINEDTTYGKMEAMIRKALLDHPEYTRDDLIIDISPKKTEDNFFVLATTTVKDPDDKSKEIKYWKGSAVLEIRVKDSIDKQKETVLAKQEDIIQTKAIDINVGFALIEGYCKVVKEACQPSKMRETLNDKVDYSYVVEELKMGGLKLETGKSNNKYMAKKIILGEKDSQGSHLEINFSSSKTVYKVDGQRKFIVDTSLNTETIAYTSQRFLESEIENKYVLEDEYKAHNISTLRGNPLIDHLKRQEISPAAFLQFIHKKDESRYREGFLPLRAQLFNAEDKPTARFDKFVKQSEIDENTENPDPTFTASKLLKAKKDLDRIKELKEEQKKVAEEIKLTNEMKKEDIVNLQEEIELESNEETLLDKSKNESAARFLLTLSKMNLDLLEFLKKKNVVEKDKGELTSQDLEGKASLELLTEFHSSQVAHLDQEEAKVSKESSRLGKLLFDEQRPVINDIRKVIEISEEFKERLTQLEELKAEADKKEPFFQDVSALIDKELENTKTYVKEIEATLKKINDNFSLQNIK